MIAKYKKIIIPVIVAVLIALGIFFKKDKEVPMVIHGNQEAPSNDVIVEIKGEVKYPGLYQLSSQARIYDLVQLAGGFTADADTDSVNMAEVLKDGTVIYVGTKKSNQRGKISLNQATLEELMTLKGIGEVKAQNIIEYRERVGGFNSINELKNVQGISENLFEQIKEYLCL